MAEIIGAIERALGAALNGIYQVVPAYGVAIVLLTIAVRALLIPLTVKQIKGFAAQQKLAPEMKKIQQKYRGMQQKAKDRSEVQQLRVQMQKEMNELYGAHGASMFGGCLPALGQYPVLIAMFAVFRASIVAVPLVATMNGAPIPANTFTTTTIKSAVCRPNPPANTTGGSPRTITCPTGNNQTATFEIGDLRDAHNQAIKFESAPWISSCAPRFEDAAKTKIGFVCRSALGSGHLPRDSRLFRDITADRATVFGMHSGCSAAQVASNEKIRQCTSSNEKGGPVKAIPYYVLIALVAVTSFYQSKQMSARQTGQQAQQQQMMTRVIPVVFALISINFPAGANVYFSATNVFTIVQQGVLFKRMGAAFGLPGPDGGSEAKPKKDPKTGDGNGSAQKQIPRQKGKKRR